MVLAPWHDPVPLQRGWCLFEIYSTIVTQSRFEVAMTQSSREAFLRDISWDPTGSINKMLATIDVAKSECFKPEDRERIFEIVRREVDDEQPAAGFEDPRGLCERQCRCAQWCARVKVQRDGPLR
jgi:hypothetical protein